MAEVNQVWQNGTMSHGVPSTRPALCIRIHHLVDGQQCFYPLNSAPKLQVVRSSEMLLTTQQTVQYHMTVHNTAVWRLCGQILFTKSNTIIC